MNVIGLTGFDDLFKLLGFFLWLLIIITLILVVVLPKTWKGKLCSILIILWLFLAFPARWVREEKQEREAFLAWQAKANSLYEAGCRKSGEFIHRTADNVDGIFLLRIRMDYGRGYQYTEDPYGYDSAGNSYILGFFHTPVRDGDKYPILPNIVGNELQNLRNTYRGYRYVEVVDPVDGERYRYTGSIKVIGKKDTAAPNVRLQMERNPNFDVNIYDFVLDRAPAPGSPPRYGVTYEDISTPEEREYWVAGSSLKVIDLGANEVIAERIGYIKAPPNAMSAWAHGVACPQPPEDDQTRKFVEKVLRIKPHAVPETPQKDTP